jgi:hypothetical protein
MGRVSTQEQFQEKLEQGRLGEGWTLYYTCRKLHYVNLPLAKIVDFEDKGPRIYVPETDGKRPVYVPVPDTLCIHRHDWGNEHLLLPPEFFLEAKLKSRCSYYRINKAWQSGIDMHSYKWYKKVEEFTGKPVWVFHLIFPTSDQQAIAQGAPREKRPAPNGLYAHPISLVPAYDPDRSPKMVYWKIEKMLRLCSVSEAIAASEGMHI